MHYKPNQILEILICCDTTSIQNHNVTMHASGDPPFTDLFLIGYRALASLSVSMSTNSAVCLFSNKEHF